MVANKQVEPDSDFVLDARFQDSWSAAGSLKFPLVPMGVNTMLSSPALHEFLKQDHLAFWNHFDGDQHQALHAILLTDIGALIFFYFK